ATAWAQAHRLPHMGALLERLSPLSSPDGPIDKSERTLYRADVADLDAALAHDPNALAALVNRPNSHARQNAFDLAVASFARAPRLERDDRALHRKRRLRRVRPGAVDAGIADFTEAQKREPHVHEAVANRDLCHANKHEHDLVIPDFTEALQVELNDEVLQYN